MTTKGNEAKVIQFGGTAVDAHRISTAMLSAAFELVTPAMAAALLANNKSNRAPRHKRIARYAQRMRDGQWRITHQGIAVGFDGTLYDGQHRLLAVVESGIAVTMLVIRGLSPEAREVIDTGEKRSTGDNLAIVDGAPISTTDAAIANILRFMLFNDGTGSRSCDVDEMRALLARFAPGIAAVKRAMPWTTRGITRAPILAAFVFAHPAAPEAVERMAAQLHSGADLSKGDPILALRSALTRAERAVTMGDHFKRTLAAIDARLNGRTMSRAVTPAHPLNAMSSFRRFAGANGIEVKD